MIFIRILLEFWVRPFSEELIRGHDSNDLLLCEDLGLDHNECLSEYFEFLNHVIVSFESIVVVILKRSYMDETVVDLLHEFLLAGDDLHEVLLVFLSKGADLGD